MTENVSPLFSSKIILSFPLHAKGSYFAFIWKWGEEGRTGPFRKPAVDRIPSSLVIAYKTRMYAQIFLLRACEMHFRPEKSVLCRNYPCVKRRLALKGNCDGNSVLGRCSLDLR